MRRLNKIQALEKKISNFILKILWKMRKLQLNSNSRRFMTMKNAFTSSHKDPSSRPRVKSISLLSIKATLQSKYVKQ